MTDGLSSNSLIIRLANLHPRLSQGVAYYINKRTSDSLSIKCGGVSARISSRTPSEVRSVYHTLLSEKLPLKRFLNELKSDDTVWDVGAYSGIYTCLAASKLSSGTVIAFEPQPDRLARLRHSYKASGLENVDIVEKGLSNFTGTTGLDGNSLASKGSEGEKKVEIVRGETLVERGEVPQPTVMKIDIEGAELDALKGCDDLLTDVRVLLCEIHLKNNLMSSIYDFGSSPEELHAYLESKGFIIKKLQERQRDYHIIAMRK